MKKNKQKHCLRITCPECGNDREFLEIADGVILTSRYNQNNDCSFSQEGDEFQVLGDVKFFCAECNTDLSQHHQRFLDMLF